jgi:D-alanyl-D-alanine carboxypeptidase (penicillin-binding protein 5/6)
MVLYRQFTGILIVLMSLVLSAGAVAEGVSARDFIKPPELPSPSYVLLDATSGTLLAEKNADEPVPPASLTKLMTIYTVLNEISEGRLNEEDEVLISRKAWQTGGSRMFLDPGIRVRVIDLMRGVIIQSGNDASVALAEHVAGEEAAFAQVMNEHARQLGLRNTNFENATGLPGDNHRSSARDMALLARAIITRFPGHYKLYSEREFTWNNITQPNRNRLLWRDPAVDGMKTGHTAAAGYCLVASAQKDGMRLVSVVMGAENDGARVRESQALLNYGFRNFEVVSLAEANQPLEEARVWKSKVDSISVGVSKSVVQTLGRGVRNRLSIEMTLNDPLQAPLDKGDPVGVFRASLGGEMVVEQPLVALEDAPQAGFFKRIWQSITMYFSELIGNMLG